MTLWSTKLKILIIWPFSGSLLISALVCLIVNPQYMLAFEDQILSLPLPAGPGARTPRFLLKSPVSPIQRMPASPVSHFRTPVIAPGCNPHWPARSGLHQRLCPGDLACIHVEARMPAVPIVFTSGRSGMRAPGRPTASSLGDWRESPESRSLEGWKVSTARGVLPIPN